jgi:hypothetical protein
MKPPMRRLRLASLVPRPRFSAAREFAAPAWPLAAMPGCAAVGADGHLMPMEVSDCLPELPRVENVRLSSPFLELEIDGVLAVIELPMREVRAELMRLLELALRSLLKLETAGVREFEALLELILPKLPVNPNVFDRDDMDVLGLTILLELLRFEKLELLGGRTNRELKLP